MSEPLDVSLRVRMRYEAGDAASKATNDIERVRSTADRLGAGAPGDRLGQGLRSVSGQAQAAERDILKVATTAARLGGSDGTARLATGLKDASQAAGGASRDLAQLGQVAARFGAVSTVSYLARDLKAVHASAQDARRDLAEVRDAADKVGRGAGIRDLEGDLQRASRRADELERRLGGVGRRTAGGGRSGNGEHHAFANEAIRASGLGIGGARLGMGAAAAGGLAVGAGVAAVGGSLAMATGRAIAFEHAMTEVGKAIGDTASGMRPLEVQFAKLSRSSGIAKTEIAGIAAQGGYFNVPRAQLPEFVDISAKAAVGFQMRPEEAGEALGPLMKSYKIPDMAGLRLAGDAVNTVGDSVGVRERNILHYLNYTSGHAADAKIPFANNAAIGGTIQSLGVAPDVAATGFQSITGRLVNANLEGKDFQRGLRAINMTGRGVKASMQQDGTNGLMEVLQRLKDLPDAKRSNAIRDIAGEGNVAAVSRMVEGLDMIKATLEKVSDPEKYRGSLEKTFKIFGSDTTASINRAGAALDGFASRVGQRFNPVIKASADIVARWLGGMTKAMELADRAKALSDKQVKGEALNEADKAELDGNPKLKAETDRQLRNGRENAARRAIVEEEGRDRARNATRPEPRGAIEAPPRAPDEQDAAASQARERTRLRLQGEIRDLDAEIGARRSGGYETTADRLRLRKLQQQYERQYPDAEGKPDATPGLGKRSDLEDGVKASLASYHGEVEQSLRRTERFTRDMGRRIAEDLTIRPKVEDAAFGGTGLGGARIERASLSGGGTGFGGGRYGLGSNGGGGVGSGARQMPGRFGGAVPEPRGGSGRIEGGPAGGGASADTPRGSGAGTKGSARTGQMMAYAMDQLRREGVPEGKLREAAGHLVGQAHMESGLDPNKVHDGGTGFGIYGARDPRPGQGRRTEMFKWLEKNGYARNSAEGQMRYMAHEAMTGRFPQTQRILRGQGSGDVDQDTNTITKEFENPKVVNRRSGAVREAMRVGPETGASREAGRAGPGAGEAGSNGKHDPLGGAARRYSSGYGMRNHPVLGGRRMHHGQDMAAPGGTGVMAMEGGKVSGINRHGDVTVTHPDGSTKTYRHIDPDGVKMGQQVEGGQQIGRLRQRDPRSTGPHLHLEATDPQGRRFDPMGEIVEANKRKEKQETGPAAPHLTEKPIEQKTPWQKAAPQEAAASPVRRVDADDDGGMYSGMLRKPEQDPVDAMMERVRKLEAENPESPEVTEARKHSQRRDTFIDAMKERAARGAQYGSAEGEAVRDPNRADRGRLDGHLQSGRDAMQRWTGDMENRDAAGRSRLQERSSDPAYRPERDLSLDEIRKYGAPQVAQRTPRFTDPQSYQLKPGAGGEASAGGAGAGRFGLGGPSVTQNFHGGFDAQEVGRRAQLEQNREVRRTMAGALHDVGNPKAA